MTGPLLAFLVGLGLGVLGLAILFFVIQSICWLWDELEYLFGGE